MYQINSDETLRVIQVTDTHLFGDVGGKLLGVPTFDSMSAVLDRVRDFDFDSHAMLVTGDLSQDGSEQSYRHLHDAMSPFDKPVFWLPGNHDEPQNLAKVGDESEHLHKVIRSKHWQIIMLDSQVEGAVFGQLNTDELAYLDKTLSEAPELHTLIALHHHPVSMDSDWMDNIGLKNRHEFLEVLGRHKNAKGVIWGHVHQSCDGLVGGVRLMATPSTCIQFSPQTTDFSLDDVAPGFRWLELHKDGSINTGVERLTDVSFEVDRTQTGY
ncbi:MAG: 3',5'-cyclic-AMP phosphodiesterase [Thalassolituus sp.]